MQCNLKAGVRGLADDPRHGADRLPRGEREDREVESGELLGGGQGREGIPHDDLRLVQGVRLRDRGRQEHRPRRGPRRHGDGARGAAGLGPPGGSRSQLRRQSRSRQQDASFH